MKCLQRLLPAHGRFFSHVVGAVGNAAVADARLLNLAHHANIHRNHICPGHRCHAVYAGNTPGKVFCHHGSHAAVRLGHTLGHHTVVRTEYHNGLPIHFDIFRILNACHFGQKILKPTKSVQRFGDPVPMAFCRFHRPLIRGPHAAAEAVKLLLQILFHGMSHFLYLFSLNLPLRPFCTLFRFYIPAVSPSAPRSFLSGNFR